MYTGANHTPTADPAKRLHSMLSPEIPIEGENHPATTHIYQCDKKQKKMMEQSATVDITSQLTTVLQGMGQVADYESYSTLKL